MTGASSEGRPEPSFYSRPPHGVSKLRLLKRASFWLAALASGVALLMVYRLVMLSTSQLPRGFPGGWLLARGLRSRPPR